MTTQEEELIDFIAVERAVEGDRSVRLTATEMAEAFRRLRAERNSEGELLSDSEIGETLGVSRTLVQKWRSGTRTPGARTGPALDVVHMGSKAPAAAVEADPIDALLRQAASMNGAKVKIAHQRVTRAIETLRIVMETERKTQAARAEVERLEKELAAAKAKLRPGRHYGPAPIDVSFRDVREWAEAQGLYVHPKGRPNNRVVEAYKDAHGIGQS